MRLVLIYIKTISCDISMVLQFSFATLGANKLFNIKLIA